MAKPKEEKTNVIRLLEAAGIPCTHYEIDLPKGEVPDGVTAAKLLGKDPDQVFKTLVLQGDKTGHVVCVVPGDSEVDLKALAKASGNKKVEMIAMKDLLSVTGYIRGGCSPIGMKKFLRTTFHTTAQDFDTIVFSGGKIGRHVELSLADLGKVIRYSVADIAD